MIIVDCKTFAGSFKKKGIHQKRFRRGYNFVQEAVRETWEREQSDIKR